MRSSLSIPCFACRLPKEYVERDAEPPGWFGGGEIGSASLDRPRGCILRLAHWLLAYALLGSEDALAAEVPPLVGLSSSNPRFFISSGAIRLLRGRESASLSAKESFQGALDSGGCRLVDCGCGVENGGRMTCVIPFGRVMSCQCGDGGGGDLARSNRGATEKRRDSLVHAALEV